MEASGATMGLRPLPFFHMPFGISGPAPADLAPAPRPRVLRRSRARIPQTFALSRDNLLNSSSRSASSFSTAYRPAENVSTPTLLHTPASPPANVDAMDVDQDIPHSFPSHPLSSPFPASTLLSPTSSPLLDDLDEFSGLAQLDIPAPMISTDNAYQTHSQRHAPPTQADVAIQPHAHDHLEPTPLAASRKCASNRNSLSRPSGDAHAARGSGRWEGILGSDGGSGELLGAGAWSGAAPATAASLLGKGARKRSSEDISGATFGGLELTRRRRIG
ncbi:uncharacterized protein SCHCODRAFT_01307335 [Schizophyllum commune H4-8]|uniref:Expressed protein n=1 Tax=Schizophyllum commune (strain H4-8 / FGSC 9210) TaxID=578458 RepID=D8Q8D3_SCHCM|nr:uncharacterized protein SCHCODRAFT_01307335 [Schizophyllum commune H4-8]KAI5891098.1 hypothetical protein SCHCODRAFT_01307335 [Schizophyllum commune H4-8]